MPIVRIEILPGRTKKIKKKIAEEQGGIMKYIVLLFILFFIPVSTYASQTAGLFVIERSKNANVVHYDVNIAAGGKIDPKEPVIAYWIMLAKDGHKEGLNSIEKNVYGFKCTLDKSKTFYHMIMNIMKDRGIKVYQQGEGYVAEIHIDGKPAYIEKVFINSTETMIFPKVHFVDLFGKDTTTGKNVHERINK